ncbi:MAG TPA: hypothetical protein VIJ79_11315 [Acidobacteriaceae bacterium]
MSKLLAATCVIVTILLATGCATHRVTAAATPPPPVVVADTVRESLPNDYLRVSFLPAGVNPTTLSRPGALRAFTTATPLYQPPLQLKDLPYYSGLENNDTNVLVAMRCRPPHPEKVDAVLATWPNVFQAIQRDVPVDSATCSANPAAVATQVSCYAAGFTDPASTSVPTALAHTFAYAGALFNPAHTALAQWLQSNYGIFRAFSGIGYSVKDSYSLGTSPMTSQQILVKSVSSEYVLKNVSLADAGCRCISVAPYPDRSSDRLDPDFIQQAGGDGVCKSVDRLQTVSH